MRKFVVLLCIPLVIGACERHPISDLHKLEGGLVQSQKEGAGHNAGSPGNAESAPAKTGAAH